MAILGFELEEIARLIALVEEGGLDEIILEEEGRKLRIRGARSQQITVSQAPVTPTYAAQMPALPPAPRKPSAANAPPQAEEGTVALTSPMVGVFYRSGKPGDPPLIEVGQRIVLKQPVGLIEAMKTYSEVLAEHAGVVVSIPVKDGVLVYDGTPLVLVKPD